MPNPPNIMMDETFLSYLQKVYNQRKSANPSYSIRAFARDLKLDQSLLSKFLRGKIDFNWKTIEHCLQKISAPEEVFEHFRIMKHNCTSEFVRLEDSVVNALGSWKYWAILEFFKIDQVCTYETIGERFQIPVDEVEEIITSLIEMGFLEQKEGKYKILKPNNSWLDSEQTTQAKKKLQKTLNEMSCKSIDEVPVELRHHCSLTVAIDQKRLPELKEKLSSLLLDFAKCSQKNNEINEVYQVTFGFFPLTTMEKK